MVGAGAAFVHRFHACARETEGEGLRRSNLRIGKLKKLSLEFRISIRAENEILFSACWRCLFLNGHI